MASFKDLSPEEQAEILHEMVVNDLNFTIVVCCLASAMVPILIIWVLFSTPKLRRQPTFWIQMLAIIMALTAAALEVSAYYIDVIYESKRMMLYSQLLSAKEVLKWLVPPLTDTALIFRLLAFYPASIYSRNKRLMLVAFPVLIKIPRLAVICVNLNYAIKDWLGPRQGWPEGLKYQSVECVLQVLDNTYVSTMILVIIYRKFYAKSMFMRTRSAFTKRATRLLFEAFTMSFLPAVLLQIALALSMVIPLAQNELTKFSDLQSYLFTTNIYVSLQFSLLATSWNALCNTTAELRITAMPHRKLRYIGTRGTPSTGTSAGNSSERSSQKACLQSASFGTMSFIGHGEDKTQQGSEPDYSETQGKSSCYEGKATTDTNQQEPVGRWQVLTHFLRKYTPGAAARTDDHGVATDHEEAGRSTLLRRHGIEPPYKGADCTLLHRLIADDDLENHASGFYSADDGDLPQHKTDVEQHSEPRGD